MKRLMLVSVFVSLLIALGSGLAFAQSSGNFNFNSDSTACVDVNGTLSGGAPNNALSTTIKVSSGNGVSLVVRPSAVAGLLTNTKISGSSGGGTQSSSAQATVAFTVSVTPLSGQGAPTVTPSGPVTYDDRFMQISTNLFNQLSECTVDAPCTFSLDETTLSAHSFDFVVQNLSAGNYRVDVSWTATPLSTNASQGTQLGCVGPVVVTVEQVKLFPQNTTITF